MIDWQLDDAFAGASGTRLCKRSVDIMGRTDAMFDCDCASLGAVRSALRSSGRLVTREANGLASLCDPMSRSRHRVCSPLVRFDPRPTPPISWYRDLMCRYVFPKCATTVRRTSTASKRSPHVPAWGSLIGKTTIIQLVRSGECADPCSDCCASVVRARPSFRWAPRLAVRARASANSSASLARAWPCRARRSRMRPTAGCPRRRTCTDTQTQRPKTMPHSNSRRRCSHCCSRRWRRSWHDECSDIHLSIHSAHLYSSSFARISTCNCMTIIFTQAAASLHPAARVPMTASISPARASICTRTGAGCLHRVAAGARALSPSTSAAAGFMSSYAQSPLRRMNSADQTETD